MPPIQQDAHQGRPTDLDLALEARANAWGLPSEDRDAILRTAELLGCDVATQRIRDAARRRARVRSAPDLAPRPGPAPRPTPPRPPILVALTGDHDPATPEDRRRDFCARMARLADEAVRGDWATQDERIAWAATARELRQPSPTP